MYLQVSLIKHSLTLRFLLQLPSPHEKSCEYYVNLSVKIIKLEDLYKQVPHLDGGEFLQNFIIYRRISNVTHFPVEI